MISPRWFPRVLSARPWILDVLVIGGLALALRSAMLHLAPVLINKDSVSYFLPGWDLANGLGFTPDYRRSPLYSWFIAAALLLFGHELSSVALLQHALGVGMVIATYALGFLLFGRVVGFLSGLLTAVSGPLIIFEQRIDAETLFGFLLTVAALFWVLGSRRWGLRWFLAGGLALGLATLARPAGQLVLLALPLALLIHTRSIRRILIPTCAATLGMLVVRLPWTLLLLTQYGQVSGGATIGEPLLSHVVFGQQWLNRAYRDEDTLEEIRADAPVYDALTRMEITFTLPSDERNPSGDRLLDQARRQGIRLLAQGQSPSAARERLERTLGLSSLEIDGVLRDIALEMIRNDPFRFVLSSLRGGLVVMLGRVESLEISWDDRRSQAGRLMEDNWYEVRRIRHLVQPVTPNQLAAFPLLNALTSVFQPSRIGAFLTALVVASFIACVSRPSWRMGLVPWFMMTILIFTSTSLSWAAARYRYPADPLIYVLAASGLVAVVSYAKSLIFQVSSLRASPGPLEASPKRSAS
ncbi:MAG: ArnT family glycosyltransferase [Chloroflexota bacterium]